MNAKQIASVTAILTLIAVLITAWSAFNESESIDRKTTTQSSQGSSSPNISDVDGNVEINN